MNILLLSFSLLCMYSNATSAQVHINDSLIVIDVFIANDIYNIKIADVATISDGRITQLFLIADDDSDTCLNGQKISVLPESISGLDSLAELHIVNGDISALPESIGELNNLRTIVISNTNISELPVSICNLTELKTLDLTDNKLVRLPECTDFYQNLEHLYLTNNDLIDLPMTIAENSLLSDSLPYIFYYPLQIPDDNQLFSVAGNLLCDPSFEVARWLDMTQHYWWQNQECSDNQLDVVPYVSDSSMLPLKAGNWWEYECIEYDYGGVSGAGNIKFGSKYIKVTEEINTNGIRNWTIMCIQNHDLSTSGEDTAFFNLNYDESTNCYSCDDHECFWPGNIPVLTEQANTSNLDTLINCDNIEYEFKMFDTLWAGNKKYQCIHLKNNNNHLWINDQLGIVKTFSDRSLDYMVIQSTENLIAWDADSDESRINSDVDNKDYTNISPVAGIQNNRIMISGSGYRIELYDLMGNMILSNTNQENDISMLSDGFYIMKICNIIKKSEIYYGSFIIRK